MDSFFKVVKTKSGLSATLEVRNLSRFHYRLSRIPPVCPGHTRHLRRKVRLLSLLLLESRVLRQGFHRNSNRNQMNFHQSRRPDYTHQIAFRLFLLSQSLYLQTLPLVKLVSQLF